MNPVCKFCLQPYSGTDRTIHDAYCFLYSRCVCRDCGQILNWKSDPVAGRYPIHRNIHQGGPCALRCITCGLRFISKTYLANHSAKDKEQFGCAACEQTFWSCRDRIAHIQEHHYVQIDGQAQEQIQRHGHSNEEDKAEPPSQTKLHASPEGLEIIETWDGAPKGFPVPMDTTNTADSTSLAETPCQKKSSSKDTEKITQRLISSNDEIIITLLNKSEPGGKEEGLFTDHMETDIFTKEPQTKERKKESDSSSAEPKTVQRKQSSVKRTRSFRACWTAIENCKQAILRCKIAFWAHKTRSFLTSEDTIVRELELVEEGLDCVMAYIMSKRTLSENLTESRVVLPSGEKFVADAFLTLIAESGPESPFPMMRSFKWRGVTLLLNFDLSADKGSVLAFTGSPRDWLNQADKFMQAAERSLNLR